MPIEPPPAAPKDSAWLGRVLPLLRVRQLYRFWPGTPPSEVMALYPDTLVVGHSRTDPPVPEACAAPDGLAALTAHLRRKKVLPLAEITRLTVERPSVATPRCRCVAYSARGKVRWELPDYEMEHLVEALRLLLGERFVVKKWISPRFPAMVLLLYFFSALLLGLGVVSATAGDSGLILAGVGGFILAAVVAFQVLDALPPKMPFERGAKAKKGGGKDLSGRQPFRSPILGWGLTMFAGLAILPALFCKLFPSLALFIIVIDEALITDAVGPGTGATLKLIAVLFHEFSWPILLAGVPILYLGYLLRQRPVNFVKNDDARPPILYLRSFLDDGRSDLQPTSRLAVALGVAPPWALRRPWRYLFMVHPIRIIRILFGRTADTSEEQLGLYLSRRGPFVAIGKPGERFATPGASRMYVTNEVWRDTVIEFLGSSQVVLVQPAKTEGIWWEVQKTVAAVEPARATEWLDRNYGDAMRQEKSTPSLLWNLRLEFQVLRREAEAAVGSGR